MRNRAEKQEKKKKKEPKQNLTSLGSLGLKDACEIPARSQRNQCSVPAVWFLWIAALCYFERLNWQCLNLQRGQIEWGFTNFLSLQEKELLGFPQCLLCAAETGKSERLMCFQGIHLVSRLAKHIKAICFCQWDFGGSPQWLSSLI